MILVPIKNTNTAKQRLASVLDQSARTKLAQAMLHDVLTALHNWESRPAVGIVTSDLFATNLAEEYGFEVIPDPENPGETGAIEMATRICVERGEDSTLVIPADIPLIQPWEFDEIMRHAPQQGSVLVPAGDGRGTNAAFRRPANLFPLRFGNDSFKPHHAGRAGNGQALLGIESSWNCGGCRQSRRPAPVDFPSGRDPRAETGPRICRCRNAGCEKGRVSFPLGGNPSPASKRNPPDSDSGIRRDSRWG